MNRVTIGATARTTGSQPPGVVYFDANVGSRQSSAIVTVNNLPTNAVAVWVQTRQMDANTNVPDSFSVEILGQIANGAATFRIKRNDALVPRLGNLPGPAQPDPEQGWGQDLWLDLLILTH